MPEIRSFSSRRLRTLSEVAILALMGAGVFWLEQRFDLVRALGQISGRHREWHLDHVSFLVTFSALAGLVFALRRSRDLHRELRGQTGGTGVGARFSARAALSNLRSALNSAPAELAVFDRQERLVFWNEGYAELLKSRGLIAARGLAFRTVIETAAGHGLSAAVAKRMLWSRSESGGTTNDEFTTADGRWIQVRVAPTQDDGFVLVMTDISEVKKMAALEAEARRLAEAGSRAKSEFLANMNHEIRTPLNGILGMAQIMSRETTEPRQRSQLAIVDASGQGLLQILNNVLDLSRIEAGVVELDIRPVDIEETVRQAAQPSLRFATERGLRLDVAVAESATGLWSTDKARLQQVLSNLIANAAKFTHRGAVSILVDDSPDGLVFQVADTGIGICADKLSVIFDSFTQGDATATRRFGGAGLGLAICKQFVALLGGELQVVSREGIGSTFSFTLPLARVDPWDARHFSPPVPPRQIATDPLRILVAEDNPTNQLVLKALLEPLNAKLVIVENGRQAIDAFSAARFDLVLMDVQMPEMNGLEATEAIRGLESAKGLARTPILAVTANVMRLQLDEYIGCGMDAVVAKPIDATLLFAAIEAALRPVDTADAA